jgi:hypothetical protein
MPYEIETKDGIVLRNIPDNIAPDSDILKNRVQLIRQSAEFKQFQAQPAEALPPEQPVAPPSGLQEVLPVPPSAAPSVAPGALPPPPLDMAMGQQQPVQQPVQQPAQQTPAQPAPAPTTPPPGEDIGFWGGLRESITGARRQTPETQTLPEWTGMPELNRFSAPSFKAALGTLVSSPQETVQVLQSNFPEMGVRQDAKGNFILRSTIDGQEYIIPPGVAVGDIPRIAGGLAIASGGGAGGIGGATLSGAARGIGKAALTAAGGQAAIEASQAATGGEFNTADVGLAGAFGGAGRAVGQAVGAAAPRVTQGVRNLLGRGEAAATQAAPEAAQAGMQAAAKVVPKAEQTVSMVPDEYLGKLAANAAKGNLDSQLELVKLANSDKTARDAANQLGFNLPEDVFARNQQVQELMGFIRSKGGQESKFDWQEAYNQFTQNVDNIFSENLGARIAYGRAATQDVATNINSTLKSTLETLGQKEESLYKEVGDAIPSAQNFSMQNTVNYLKDKQKRVELNPVERKVLDFAQTAPASRVLTTQQLLKKAEVNRAKQIASNLTPEQRIAQEEQIRAVKKAQQVSTKDEEAFQFMQANFPELAPKLTSKAAPQTVPRIKTLDEARLFLNDKEFQKLQNAIRGVTYEGIDQQRKNVNAAITGINIRGEANLSSKEAADLSRVIYQDQRDAVLAATGNPTMVRTLDDAKDTSIKKFQLTNDMEAYIGQKFAGSIADKLDGYIAKGEFDNLQNLVNFIPEEYKKTAIATSLANVTRNSSGNIDPKTFINFYDNLRKTPKSYALVVNQLGGTQADDVLRGLYSTMKYVNQAKIAAQQAGKVSPELLQGLDAPTNKILSWVSSTKAGKAARESTIGQRVSRGAFIAGGAMVSPLGAVGADVLHNSLVTAGKDNAEAFAKLLRDPNFQRLLAESATKEVVPPSIVKKATTSPKFIKYAKSAMLDGNKPSDWERSIMTILQYGRQQGQPEQAREAVSGITVTPGWQSEQQQGGQQ